MLLLVAGFGLLVAGPQPWRATRWAWFWLLLPPVGGWAFLLAIPLSAVLGPYLW